MRHNRKITQELISSICDRILQGERIRAVAKAEAIGRSTFFYWLSRGESSRSGIYHQFFKQYHRAKTAYEARAIEKVIDATKERITEKALAAELGITPRSWQNWKLRGEKDASGFYHEVVQAIAKTQEANYQEHLNVAVAIARSRKPVTPTESLRILARLSPEMWGGV